MSTRISACFQLQLAETVSDDPIPTNETSPSKPKIFKRQSSLALWLRSKSEPGPAKGGDPSAHHPSSSDDYPDQEMAELLVNIDAMNNSSAIPTPAAYPRKAGEAAKLEQSSSSEDTFETPPTTPPLRKRSSLGPSTDRKRSHPDSMQAPPSRHVSRKTSSEKSAQEVSGSILLRELSQTARTDFKLLQSIYQQYSKKADPTLPPDKNSTAMITKSQYAYPRQPAQSRNPESEPAKFFGSFDNTTSVSSSMTSASSTWTSPNTSFSVRSLATSFDASVDGTDTAVRGSWDNPSRPPLLSHSLSGSESDVAKWYENEASKVSTDKPRAPSDPMDLDYEFVVTDKNASKAESLYLPRQIEAKTSETVVGALLAGRLQENPPFGSSSPLLMFCSSLLILLKTSSSSRTLSISAIPTAL